MENEEQVETTETNQNKPTVTVETKNSISQDTADQIATLKRDLSSANSRIGELNKENKQYRLLKNTVENLGATPETLKTQIEDYNSKIEKYSQLGEVEELSKKLETLQKQADEGYKVRSEQIATQSGFKPLLADFAIKNNFKLKQVDAKDKDDKTIKQSVAVTLDAENKEVETPLNDFLSSNYSDYLPAFVAEPVKQKSAVYAPTPSESAGEKEQKAEEKKAVLGSSYVTRNAF